MPDITADFPDAANKVVTIWISDPIIPNDTVAFATSLPADMRAEDHRCPRDRSVPHRMARHCSRVPDIAGAAWKKSTIHSSMTFRVYLQSIKFDFNNYNG